MRAGYFWGGPLGGTYSRQGADMGALAYPTCLPPLSCDRAEFAPLLVAHWAYVLMVDPCLIPIYPTLAGGEHDDGF